MYPFGATLNVVKPAIPVLSSGTVSLPVNRPICAFHSSKVNFFSLSNTQKITLIILTVLNVYNIISMVCFKIFVLKLVLLQHNSGKLVVLGSVHMFSDQYFDKEENSKVQVGFTYTGHCITYSPQVNFKHSVLCRQSRDTNRNIKRSVYCQYG